MKHLALFGSALLLAACQGPMVRSSDTHDRIAQELKEAAAQQKRGAASEAAIGQAMLPPLQAEATQTPPKAEPRFDLAVNNAAASQVFMALVAGTPYSMLFSPELSGNLTLNLKGVTVREALETIRELYGYEFKIQGKRIFIQSNTLQTRMFQINYLAGRRQGRTDVRVTSSSPSSTPSSGTPSGQAPAAPGSPPAPAAASGQEAASSRVMTSSDSDFWKELNLALGTIIGDKDGRAVIINPVSGVVLVKAMPGEMRNVENYLKATQLIAERQVMLEAKILEVQLKEDFQSGINWAKFRGVNKAWSAASMAPGTTLGTTNPLVANATGQSSTTATVTPGRWGNIATSNLGKGFFGLAFQSEDFVAMMNFLETQGNVQVLSSPRVAAVNNQKAVLKVGTDDYFVTNVSTTTTTSTGGSNVVSPSITLQPFFSGVALDVTPQISEEGHVILHIHPSVSQVQEKSKIVDLGTLGTFTLPLASSSVSETDSIVRVLDGHIVAIGGLMSQSQSVDSTGLPFLHRIGGVGNLFGQKGNTFAKRELVILLKPTVVQGDNWRQDLLDSEARIEGMRAWPKPGQD